MCESNDVLSAMFNEVLLGNEGSWWVAGLLIHGNQSSPDQYTSMMTRYAISYAIGLVSSVSQGLRYSIIISDLQTAAFRGP